MSLLDSGGVYEPCTVYPEIVTTDIDGNIKTKPSATGTPATARFQVQGQSGTSSRRSEQDNEGYESEKVYEMRLSRASELELGVLGAQSEILWNSKRWAMFGDINRYNSSRRTQHNIYIIKRY